MEVATEIQRSKERMGIESLKITREYPVGRETVCLRLMSLSDERVSDLRLAGPAPRVLERYQVVLSWETSFKWRMP